MKSIELDCLPSLVESGQLTCEQAVMEIFHIIYTNPARFLLQTMTPDEKSDFLLSILPDKIRHIYESYDKNLSPFGAYIYRSIQLLKTNWIKKNHMNRIYFENYLVTQQADCYSRTLENNPELSLEVSDCKKNLEFEYSDIQTTSENKSPCNDYSLWAAEGAKIKLKRIFTEQPFSFKAEKKFLKHKRTALILALKSAWYITDNQIDNISQTYKIDKETLSQNVCAIKSKLITRALTRQNTDEHRNIAYSLYNGYKTIMKSFDDKTNLNYLQYKKKYEYQKRSWKNKISILQSNRLKIAPTNKEVAEYLGINPRDVSYYIEYARKKTDKFK